MRHRSSGILAAALSAVALIGCGDNGNESAAPPQGQGAQSGSVDGRELFTQRCSSCHTLADADAAGSVGPNLDEAQPDRQRVEEKVRAGGGGMPAFADQLRDEQIRGVADYVARVAGK